MGELSERLDPVAQLLLQAIAAAGRPRIETIPVAEARRQAAESLIPVMGMAEAMQRIDDLWIPSGPGPIGARVYVPVSVPFPCPTIVFFHGGGWVICDLDTHDVVCRAIANRARGIVVSVDYRLAPEHKFPAAPADCYAAAKWIAENIALFGGDVANLSVAGDSAGGNLAAVVCLIARENGGPPIARQALVYPVTDLTSFDTDSYREFAEGYQLTRAGMQWFIRQYLASPEDAMNPHASPLLAADLSGLPPALVITAECDPLRDEGEAYARRLRQAGVEVVSKRYDGMIHPFFSLLGALPQAMEAVEQVAEFVAGRAATAAC